MKIKPEHFQALKGAIGWMDTDERRLQYLAGDFINADKVKDLDRRYRWDLMWDIPVEIRRPVLNAMYEYMNDDHIDTALRKIVRPL